MSTQMKSDDVIFKFFKEICDEKNDEKCVELGNNWIKAMEKNLDTMQSNLGETDRIKYKKNIESNKQHLNSLKDKTASEWREYATQCMVEIIDHKS